MWFLIASAFASPWIPESGEVRASVGFQQLVSKTQFASTETAGRLGPRCPEAIAAGDRAPYDCTTGGQFINRSALLDVNVGVGHHLAVDLFVPVVLDASFRDELGTTRARGLGDVRGGLRYGREHKGLAFAGTLHAKAPTGPAGLVDRDVPLGDAQWDVVFGGRIGNSLHPWGWAELHNQVVVRLKSVRSGTNPGEEWTGSLGGGFTPVPWAGVQLRGEWIAALDDRDRFGLKHPGRQLFQARGGVFARAERLWIEVGVAQPLVARRWPGGTAWGGSVAWTFR